MVGGPHPEKKHTSAFCTPGFKHALERETRHNKGIHTGRRTSKRSSGSPRGGHLCPFTGETWKGGWTKSLEVFLYVVLYGWLGDVFYGAPYGCPSGEKPLRTLLTLGRESTQHTPSRDHISSARWVSKVPREGLSSLIEAVGGLNPPDGESLFNTLEAALQRDLWRPRSRGTWRPRSRGTWRPRSRGTWRPRSRGTWRTRSSSCTHCSGSV
jgi:hypothetical protein